jgi:hypothetical protein
MVMECGIRSDLADRRVDLDSSDMSVDAEL